jgi:hypothetical protein
MLQARAFKRGLRGDGAFVYGSEFQAAIDGMADDAANP